MCIRDRYSLLQVLDHDIFSGRESAPMFFHKENKYYCILVENGANSIQGQTHDSEVRMGVQFTYRQFGFRTAAPFDLFLLVLCSYARYNVHGTTQDGS